MCYVIAPAGLQVLRANDRSDVASDAMVNAVDARQRRPPGDPARRDAALRQACHDVHVTGWALALVQILDGSCSGLRGPQASALSPPYRSGVDGRTALAPADLRLPGGRTPHDFLRSDGSGQRLEVEQFETLRPDATIEVAAAAQRPVAIDLMIEREDRLSGVGITHKLQRYDHFFSGWSAHTDRYGRRAKATPAVVFVCRDRARARACARAADPVLRACRAYAGEYPLDWEYLGRERILFVAERDVHERLLHGYAVPRLPPEVRVTAAHGDPRAGESLVETCEILAAR
jgi:hypothetical protein